ncbi:TadE/TadG family type IV pilus assembly protein [Streptomyces sp. NPDC002018]|uniref:TadE/TadG family type IV pilus assembly protein n=1 Tax=Streptomyces sp. NPDC002018 TaxID=3364629 RepID=UPI00367D5243
MGKRASRGAREQGRPAGRGVAERARGRSGQGLGGRDLDRQDLGGRVLSGQDLGGRVLSGRGQRGQAAIEYVGVVVLLIFVVLAAIQLGIAAYAVQQAGTASRAAARAATYREATTSPQTAGEAAVSDWLDITIEDPTSFGEEITVTANVEIPAILPVFDFGEASRSTTMPLD